MSAEWTCQRAAEALPVLVDQREEVEPLLVRHVESCLRCQATLVQYRKLLRALRDLRTEVIQPGPGLLPEILASLGERGEKRAVRSLLHGRRVAYLSSIAAAATAGAAGVIVWVSRTRSRKGMRLAS